MKMWRERSQMRDDPLIFAINTITTERHNSRAYILGLPNDNVDDIFIATETMKSNVNVSTSSRRTVYKEINPGLSVSSIYTTKHNKARHERKAYTFSPLVPLPSCGDG